MKVLQVNCVYNEGSTGKIVADIHHYLLEKGIESVVCYGRGKNKKEKYTYKISNELYSKINNLYSRITGYMYGGCYFSTNKLKRIIKKEKPDIVHLHCLNSYFVNIYSLIRWLKSNNYKTILTLHAEFMYTANCGYALDCEKWKNGCGNCPRLKQETKSILFDNTNKSWKKLKESFSNYNDLTIVSVSPWLMNRAKESPLLSSFHHIVILNGINTKVFHKYETTKLKREMNIENNKIIFHATPYLSSDPNHIKGGYYIIELAKKLNQSNTVIVVAGDYDKSINYPKNIILLGNVTNQTLLSKYYSMADVFVLSSKKETFSMTTIESLCCGTPVVGFKAGAPEEIAIKDYSFFVEYGNIEDLHNSIIRVINEKKPIEISDVAKSKYSCSTMANNYLVEYKKIYKGDD